MEGRAHLSALQGDCWRFTIAKLSALSLSSRHPDKKKGKSQKQKAREQEVYVRRFCSESVRRSGAGALTFTSGGERMAVIPYRVELQLSPPAFRFRSDLRCPSPLSAIVSLPLPYHINHYVIYTHWAVVSAQASYARFGNCICREKGLYEFCLDFIS